MHSFGIISFNGSKYTIFPSLEMCSMLSKFNNKLKKVQIVPTETAPIVQHEDINGGVSSSTVARRKNIFKLKHGNVLHKWKK